MAKALIMKAKEEGNLPKWGTVVGSTLEVAEVANNLGYKCALILTSDTINNQIERLKQLNV